MHCYSTVPYLVESIRSAWAAWVTLANSIRLMLGSRSCRFKVTEVSTLRLLTNTMIIIRRRQSYHESFERRFKSFWGSLRTMLS